MQQQTCFLFNPMHCLRVLFLKTQVFILDSGRVGIMFMIGSSDQKCFITPRWHTSGGLTVTMGLEG